MITHNIGFCGEIRKIFICLSLISEVMVQCIGWSGLLALLNMWRKLAFLMK